MLKIYIQANRKLIEQKSVGDTISHDDFFKITLPKSSDIKMTQKHIDICSTVISKTSEKCFVITKIFEHQGDIVYCLCEPLAEINNYYDDQKELAKRDIKRFFISRDILK